MFTGRQVIPLKIHAQGKTPHGLSLELAQRGDAWYLSADRIPVRETGMARVEEVAVIAVCQPLAVKRQPRVLLEGFGLGTAARKAIQVLPPRGFVTVAEGCEDMVVWQRRHLPPVEAPKPDHFRVLRQSLRECVRTNPASFDGIVLELDYVIDPFLETGSRPAHYVEGLQMLRGALRERGSLAIHSREKDIQLMKALEAEGFVVEHRLEAPHKRSKARRHHLVLASLPAPEEGR